MAMTVKICACDFYGRHEPGQGDVAYICLVCKGAYSTRKSVAQFPFQPTQVIAGVQHATRQDNATVSVVQEEEDRRPEGVRGLGVDEGSVREVPAKDPAVVRHGFVRLTSVDKGNEIWAEADQIRILGRVSEDRRSPAEPARESTRVDFDHAGSVRVRETPAEILDLIGRAKT